MSKDGGDAAPLAGWELGAPSARIQMIEQDLVNAIADGERLQHAVVQIRNGCGSWSWHAIASLDEASVKAEREQVVSDEVSDEGEHGHPLARKKRKTSQSEHLQGLKPY